MTIFVGLCVLCLLVLFGYSGLPNLLIRIFKIDCVWKLSNPRAAALTFDDGPDAKYTPRLLDILRECNVQATFFVVVEKALRNPELIQRMIEDGHDIQIHGYTHAFLPALSPRAAVAQLLRSEEILRSQFHLRTRLYRPPWGLCNLASMLAARRFGYRLTTWSVMVGDWRNVPAQELLQRILRRLHPGAILVLHDSDETWGSQAGSPEHVLELIPTLVEQLRFRGYHVGSMAQLGLVGE